MDDQILFEKTTFWTNQGILFCEICNDDPNINLQLETTEKYIGAITSLCNNCSMPFLIDIRDLKGTYTVSAAKLLASSPELEKVRLIEVFVVNSVNMKLLVNSYKRIYNPHIPYEIFENYDKAIEYCIEIKNKYNGSN